MLMCGLNSKAMSVTSVCFPVLGRSAWELLNACPSEISICLQCHLLCKVGLGLTYLSHTDDLLAGMLAQKQFVLGPAINPILLKLKAQADFNAQTSQVSRFCSFN